MTKTSTSTWVDIVFKILAGCVMPVMLWGGTIEIRAAIQAERVTEIQNDLKELSAVTNSVQENSLALVRLESKLDNLDEKIDEVKVLLSNRP